MSQLADTNWESFKTLREIMGGGLPFQGRVHGEHDLIYAASRNAPDEPFDREILGSDAFQRGEPPAEHMVTTREEPRAVERPQVRHLLHHAQHLLVAALVAADG